MADITNTQAVRFANEKARIIANEYYKLYLMAKQILQEWNAQGLASVIPNDSSIIVDGAGTDGRPIATGAMVTNQITRAGEVITDLEGSGNAKLNTIVSLSNLVIG
jgi:hypothetical protein